ncbi:MetQ/NlpA family ABC transporter substrate-binding protein [uncultured Oceanisphaera sp.]|uniref:MetQ/NlpA family ABC transporter substrate-binding protein n=1 Tax=uncultured Oceanisphaera sp. TaxID=353858 RepID=UPI002611B0F6|nr:MetQ/NlpA family ABC transporter substrate-binding protein [uncultured Oceanisphaera sp.]
MRRTLLKLPLLALAFGTFPVLAVDADKKEIVIGTTVGDFANMVTESIKPQLEAQGYRVKLVEFTDYVMPNLALAEGALDVNCFQHQPYLETFSKDRGLELSPVTQVPTGPMGLYSGKQGALDEVKKGSTVAIPNDPTNQARALLMLADLGWITLRDDIDPLRASEFDVADNPKGIKLIPLEAAQLPRSRQDVDFAVINGNYAASSGIAFGEGLFLERSYDFINWVVVRSEDKDKDFVQDVVDAYNAEAFKDYAVKRFEGYKYPESWGR